MRIRSLISFIGFLILIAATYCPLLRPFGLFNMNVYQLSKPFGLILLLVSVIGIVGVFLNQIKLVRIAGLTLLILVVLLFGAAYFKVHTAFSWLPFKGIAKFFTSKLVFKWGWYLLFAGPVIALAGCMGKQTKYSR